MQVVDGAAHLGMFIQINVLGRKNVVLTQIVFGKFKQPFVPVSQISISRRKKQNGCTYGSLKRANKERNKVYAAFSFKFERVYSARQIARDLPGNINLPLGIDKIIIMKVNSRILFRRVPVVQVFPSPVVTGYRSCAP